MLDISLTTHDENGAMVYDDARRILTTSFSYS